MARLWDVAFKGLIGGGTDVRIGTVVLLIVLAGLTVLPVAHGQDSIAAARTQLMTALSDVADLTHRGTSLSAAHLHMRRMINCLEGPGGKNFTVAAGNPFQGQGSGIFNDLRAAAGNAKVGTALRFAEAAHGFALQGSASTDVGVAQTYAWMVAFDLNNALDALR